MIQDKNREIEILIRARYPIIYIVSWEEKRVEEALAGISRARNKGLYLWTATDGLSSPNIGGHFADSLKDPVEILNHISKSKESALYILKDFHVFMEEPRVIRKLKDTAGTIKTSHNNLIIIGSQLKISTELEKEITVVDYPLPTYEDIRDLLRRLVDSIKMNPKVRIDLNAEIEEKIVKAAMGLTLNEAENVFARAVVMNNRLGDEDIDVILLEKEQIIRKTGTLEYYHANESFSQIGGLDHLKKWLTKRGAAFSEKASKYGLPQPKGILLLGVQGCGKSLCAKVISSLWNLPLLRLDMGSIFSGLVGSSESNIRKATLMAESLSPCVLWIDEIEKGLSGMQSSGMSDGGTTARVFGTLLTWMQEKSAPVFVIATSNDIAQLPPEMLRKGRFDEIFFVDLPTSLERRQIFEIHIKKRNRNPANFNIDELIEASAGFSGAEIEQAVIEGMFDAFSEDREIETRDIKRALNDTFPLSRTMSEKIESLRVWAEDRARKASPTEDELKKATGNVMINRDFESSNYTTEERKVLHIDLKRS